MRLKGGRTGKRAVVCEDLGADRPDEAVRPRGLVRRARGRARLQRLGQVALPAAARRRRQRPRRRAPAGRATPRSRRSGTPAGRSWARACGPAGSCRPTSTPSWSGARCWRSCIAATTTATGCRASPRRGRWTATSSRTPPTSASSRSPAASRRGSRSCCWSCPARPCCCSTSRPTTSTWSRPRRWRRVSRGFEGTVLAVTHDRWFARGFDRFLVYGADGSVYESDGPVWDEGRVRRAR